MRTRESEECLAANQPIIGDDCQKHTLGRDNECLSAHQIEPKQPIGGWEG